jgi:hypothetical protein
MKLQDKYLTTLNRLCKWRSVLAGWHLGTGPKTTPGVQAMRDLRDLTMLLRVETNALTKLLLDKGVFSNDELLKQIIEEAEHYEEVMAEKFPGMRAVDDGVAIYNVALAQQTMARLGFPF